MKFRGPGKDINLEVLSSLELVETRIYPLPGGTGRRWTNEIDARLSKAGLTPVGDVVTFYEHIATVRDKRTKTFYVSFRETVDAQLAREKDPTLYPEWLMKSKEKQRERLIHIYMVMKHPSTVPIIRSQDDWLATIPNDSVFDALWYFLSQNNVVPRG
jgi:hypothetical protein